MKSKAGSILLTIFNLAILACIVILAARVLIDNPPLTVAVEDLGTPGQILWGPRALDVLAQSVVLFTGILGIILLFRKEDEK